MANNINLQLGIAKIGELLIKNEISRVRGGEALKGINLKIPNYQRPYKWTAKNAIQLLDDIIDAKNSNKEVYRVGTLILHYNENDRCYNIVDGQQRIMTFVLLLTTLCENHIDFLKEKLPDNPSTRENIANNFRAFERRCDAMVDEHTRTNIFKDHQEALRKDRAITELRDFVEQQCELIVVITNNISEAFQFFDSQNARGKKLYPHDLLKAYHLREMDGIEETETERIVKRWENIDQKDLASLFAEYLYRVREWVHGNKAWGLNEHNIDKFKGISRHDNLPYAQFYKGAYAYAEMLNQSAMPFVSGMRELNPFQIDAPIISGKPFFDYTNHYFNILKDIQNNDKYMGYFINGNKIVETRDLRKYKNGIGNRIIRNLFDLAALLYVDRFCPDKPTRLDIDIFEQFVVMDFIWAYSLRAQYSNLGWLSAQNYIMGNGRINSFNLYKCIAEASSPTILLSELAGRIHPLTKAVVKANTEDIDENDKNIYQNYLHYFVEYKFYIK
ncbi:DUF262 domain-containing protein [Prevotella sp. oral taxon 376]|uniref:DUF262 domain-containing protein n=1 Tax=Prevotella sp. oral taxon 376 TaxID=712466 RepID=UPI000D1DEB8C|nr:DUF262 domain-containing protein [Prevotella sp. oral taxon 376]PTL33242.1 DUF262 domain-containing protein [Prevotella sp. oral taxon 376]